MNTTVKATMNIHQASLTAAERRRLSEISERLSRYFRSVSTVRWVIGHVANFYTVSIKVHARSGYYYARAEADRVGQGIDQAFDKIVRQRRRKRVATLTVRSRRGIAAKKAMTRIGGNPSAAKDYEIDRVLGSKAMES